ncbi:MAG TPA: nucleoside-diphosphate kinase [Candidatus Norongarragalinales archaeon]|jgi:nucleoside-diphosphate kinase|nr:nucleoside-diphosphate kinase [Candidatus Norongarragalinales archaeon]
MANEKTFVMIKPDGVQRAIIGDIVSRFERAGLRLIAMKMTKPSKELVAKHYPDTAEWYGIVGGNTVKGYKEQGIDVKKQFGTEDPVEIGKKVKVWLCDFICSGPVVAMVWEGNQAIAQVRKIVGATVPTNATPGTIRGDYTVDSADLANHHGRPIKNIIHASGNPQEADNEIGLWFKKEELYAWKRSDENTMFGK